MRATIFGATGGTGQHVVRTALNRGYEVVAFARTPSNLEIEHERLTVIKGDITESERVEEVIEGTDAVISTLGPGANTPSYEISEGMQNIIDAMQAYGVERLIVSMGAGVIDPRDKPTLMNRAFSSVLKVLARNVYQDMNRVNELVRTSDLKWTIARAPMLTDEPATGDLQVGYIGEGTGPRLSREEYARFLVDQVERETYIHKAPVVSN